ncbi:hypothetical protein QUB70_15035 [Microcoleus sp. A003_D6]|uniref:hypothetical protein n=1 Tax=Microcoleus sp. A003_D6 TaxID=3055266 RepID=UPI002FD1865E
MLTRFSAINVNGQDARSTADKFYLGGTGILPVANLPQQISFILVEQASCLLRICHSR